MATLICADTEVQPGKTVFGWDLNTRQHNEEHTEVEHLDEVCNSLLIWHKVEVETKEQDSEDHRAILKKMDEKYKRDNHNFVDHTKTGTHSTAPHSYTVKDS